VLTLSDTNNTQLSIDALKLAEASAQTLRYIVEHQDEKTRSTVVRLSIEREDGSNGGVSLPGASLSLLASLLRELGHGKQVAVLSTDTELTTQQAADMINVSRPYLVKLLAMHKIPFRTVGPRRRILLRDLLSYKEQETVARNRGLDELVSESQNLGLY
jgi:excisionase family DNA binding protein